MNIIINKHAHSLFIVTLRLRSNYIGIYECAINIFTIMIAVLHDILVCYHY